MKTNRPLQPSRRSTSFSYVGLFALAVGVCLYIMPLVASAQQTICPAGQSACGSKACFNLQSDPQHCGSCGTMCTFGTSCFAGTCVGAAPQPIYACKFTTGKLSSSIIQPTGLQLTGPPHAPCSDNYGSSGTQVMTGMQASSGMLFACKFIQGPMAGSTIVPTGVGLSGPEGQPCTDNYGNNGAVVQTPRR